MGIPISNRRRRKSRARTSTPACAQRARQTAADMNRLPRLVGGLRFMAVEQADERHRSKRRERSPVASSRARNEPGRGHHGDPANALRMDCERVPARWLRVLFIFMAKPHSSTQQAASVTARFYKEDLGYPVFGDSKRRPNNPQSLETGPPRLYHKNFT